MNRWQRRWYDKGHLHGARTAADAYAEGHRDARKQAIAEMQERHRYEDARRLASLRAKVEALRERGTEPAPHRYALIRRADVLALLDGDSDD